jgi:hypothetical protein
MSNVQKAHFFWAQAKANQKKRSPYKIEQKVSQQHKRKKFGCQERPHFKTQSLTTLQRAWYRPCPPCVWRRREAVPCGARVTKKKYVTSHKYLHQFCTETLQQRSWPTKGRWRAGLSLASWWRAERKGEVGFETEEDFEGLLPSRDPELSFLTVGWSSRLVISTTGPLTLLRMYLSSPPEKQCSSTSWRPPLSREHTDFCW